MVNKIVPDCHADRQEETVVVVSAAPSCECKKGRGSTRGMGGCGVRPTAGAEHSGRNSTWTGRATLLFCEPATTRRPDDTSRRCATTAYRRSAVVLVSNCRIMLLVICPL